MSGFMDRERVTPFRIVKSPLYLSVELQEFGIVLFVRQDLRRIDLHHRQHILTNHSCASQSLCVSMRIGTISHGPGVQFAHVRSR